MPLNPAGAKTALGAAFAAGYGDEAAAANAWGDAIGTLTAGVVPASTTVAAAVAALKTALTGFNAPGAAAATLESALATFVTTVGSGMAGWTAVPPVPPAGISFSNGTDAQAAADAIIDTLDAWLKTGTATLIAPPNTVVNWS